MKKIYKCLNVFISVCFAAYSMPVFASSSQVNHSTEIKIKITDKELSEIVGANGNVDATMVDYKVPGSKATAVFTNRFSVGTVSYTLDVVDTNGNVLENLAMGNIGINTSMLVSGTPTITTNQNKYIQARIWHAGLPGLVSKDSTWAP